METQIKRIKSFSFSSKTKLSTDNKCDNKCNSQNNIRKIKTTTSNYNCNNKKEIKAKRAKYNTVNPHKVLSDLKNTAYKSISNVKTTFDNLSQRLKITSPKQGKNSENSYDQLDNNCQTPIKLYSPFGFETPSPSLRREKLRCHRELFVSPTGKIKEDAVYVTNGFNELSVMSEVIKNRINE